MDTWQEIWQTLQREFSDLPSSAEWVKVLLRLFVAAILSGLLGLEREAQGKSAGMRTHMLVGIGSALFVLIPQQLGVEQADMTRVLQGVVAGIGFLGAGTIIKSESEQSVHGLTTAAGIWLTAAIGIAAGMGRETSAILSTAFALVILSVVPRITSFFGIGDDPNDKSKSRDPKQAKKDEKESSTPAE